MSRPTLFTDANQARLISLARRGYTTRNCAEVCLISPETLKDWLWKGSKNHGNQFSTFYLLYQQARADWIKERIDSIEETARGRKVTRTRTYVDDQGREVTDTYYNNPDWNGERWLLTELGQGQFGDANRLLRELKAEYLSLVEKVEHLEHLNPLAPAVPATDTPPAEPSAALPATIPTEPAPVAEVGPDAG